MWLMEDSYFGNDNSFFSGSTLMSEVSVCMSSCKKNQLNIWSFLTWCWNILVCSVTKHLKTLNLKWLVPVSFFSFIFISWRLITLQYYSGFCHTLTWISHGFTCVSPSWSRSRLPPHLIPLGLPSAPALNTCLMHPTWAGDLFHPW